MAVDNNKAGIAQDIAQAADDLRIVLAKCRDIWDRYNDTGVLDDVTALPNASDPVPGTDFDKQTMTDAVYALQLFATWMDGGPRQSLNKAAALVKAPPAS
ncbi:MAG TPA: hypothetical protein PKD46_17100 [Aggregatilineaceae bacterium]|nr:hypothetical protein [Aggregatilineaceae bacterium]